jgi:DNA-binding transcriptional ArsR family regulator
MWSRFTRLFGVPLTFPYFTASKPHSPLVQRDGQTLFELCGRLILKHGIGSSRQAISQHLEVLEKAGLVIAKREGRHKFHWFHGGPLKAITRRWPANRHRS